RSPVQALQHLGYGVILVTPAMPGGLIDVAEIERIARPYPHLVRRAHGDPQEPPELDNRARLLAEPFGNVDRYGLRRPANLIAERLLLDRRQPQTDPMDIQRQSIRPLEDLQVLKGLRNHHSHPSVI